MGRKKKKDNEIYSMVKTDVITYVNNGRVVKTTSVKHPPVNFINKGGLKWYKDKKKENV